jgi:hypothetical protein
MNPFPGTLNIDLLGGLLTCSCYAPSRIKTVAACITIKELTAAGTVLD